MAAILGPGTTYGGGQLRRDSSHRLWQHWLTTIIRDVTALIDKLDDHRLLYNPDMADGI